MFTACAVRSCHAPTASTAPSILSPREILSIPNKVVMHSTTAPCRPSRARTRPADDDDAVLQIIVMADELANVRYPILADVIQQREATQSTPPHTHLPPPTCPEPCFMYCNWTLEQRSPDRASHHPARLVVNRCAGSIRSCFCSEQPMRRAGTACPLPAPAVFTHTPSYSKHRSS
jgi:hypothetical protein